MMHRCTANLETCPYRPRYGTEDVSVEWCTGVQRTSRVATLSPRRLTSDKLVILSC